jgi:predicted permease
MAPALESILSTFSASIRSVGTAVTLAAVGVYLHRRDFVVGSGKRTLALISQQVTFPLFLFTKILYCNQDWSEVACPDVTKSLNSVWMLLFWPMYVCGTGVAVGALVAFLAQTPKSQVRAVLAACGFGNSTGLPITLLTVVHTNFPTTSDLGRIDPTLFLSVYLILYPVLQWGFGGWLLAPDYDPVDNHDTQQNGDKEAQTYSLSTTVTAESTPLSPAGRPRLASASLGDSFRMNVLNNKQAENYYMSHRCGLSSMDEGLYISEVNLAGMAAALQAEETQQLLAESTVNAGEGGLPSVSEDGLPPASPLGTPDSPFRNLQPFDVYPNNALSPPRSLPPMNESAASPGRFTPLQRRLSEATAVTNYEVKSLWETVGNILNRCLQPPVVGALGGIFCAMTPLRGYFVDIVDRSAHAPLQWLFDALYAVGQTAVPINMMILGCNLSASSMNADHEQKTSKSDSSFPDNANLLSTKTMVWIVIGKMIIMPIVGIVSALVLRTWFWDIPDEIDGAFYLVLMIVFITPTANNVMVMVELSGSDTKEGIARVIALQYAVAPVILSLTMTVAIGVASDWS